MIELLEGEKVLGNFSFLMFLLELTIYVPKEHGWWKRNPCGSDVSKYKSSHIIEYCIGLETEHAVLTRTD